MTEQGGSFRVASWNVHMGLHNDGGLNQGLIEACSALEADVLVLVEACWWGRTDSSLVDRVAEAMGAEAFIYRSPDPPSRYPIDWTVAILSTLPASRQPDLPLAMYDGRGRAMPVVELGAGITIAGVHQPGVHSWRFPWRWWRQRRQLGEHGTQVDIMAGDFNMWGPIVERDASRQRPMRRAVRAKTWPAERPHSQIDHILVSDRLAVVDSGVAADQGSDHLAVWAQLEVCTGLN